MSTMIERVARAIRRKYNIEIFDRDEEDGWEYSLDQARAAIEAMREPTENMLDYGACYEDPQNEYKHNPLYDEGDLSRDVYKAMIDAALKESA